MSAEPGKRIGVHMRLRASWFCWKQLRRTFEYEVTYAFKSSELHAALPPVVASAPMLRQRNSTAITVVLPAFASSTILQVCIDFFRRHIFSSPIFTRLQFMTFQYAAVNASVLVYTLGQVNVFNSNLTAVTNVSLSPSLYSIADVS